MVIIIDTTNEFFFCVRQTIYGIIRATAKENTVHSLSFPLANRLFECAFFFFCFVFIFQ